MCWNKMSIHLQFGSKSFAQEFLHISKVRLRDYFWTVYEEEIPFDGFLTFCFFYW